MQDRNAKKLAKLQFRIVYQCDSVKSLHERNKIKNWNFHYVPLLCALLTYIHACHCYSVFSRQRDKSNGIHLINISWPKT
jgi:hypothetical protein